MTKTRARKGALAAFVIVAGLAAAPVGPAPAEPVSTETTPAGAESAPLVWRQVSVGGRHACGIRSSGRLSCWGSDSSGALGDGGADVDHATPVAVVGGATNWSTVGAGSSFTCALKTTGRLYCWGSDSDGQLGDGGENTNRATPVQVAGGATNWASVSVGGSHACARKTSGRLYCWGYNDSGLLGNGDYDDRATPVQVAGGATDWASVSAGGDHTCARKTTGRLYCWGSNNDGRLGHGSVIGTATPTEVLGDTTDWASVTAGGRQTCARKTTGRLFCWGYNGFGALGDGTDTDQYSPVEVLGGATDWTSVSTGFGHTCARKTSGQLWCWGFGVSGQVGDGASTGRLSPVAVAGAASDWTAFSAGGQETCARRATGRVYCWGADENGQLGDAGTNTNQPAPVEVVANPGRTDWTQLSAGRGHTCALRATGRLYCWGDDAFGQLGNGGADADQPRPVQVAGGATTWTSVSTGDYHTCARRASGRLYCWGRGVNGQLGDGTSSQQSTPVQVAGGATNWSAVSSGGSHTCARTTTRRLFCWGFNAFGQVGDNDVNADQPLPVEVSGSTTDWSSVSAGTGYTCARKTTGRLYCWGSDGLDQLGDGPGATDQPAPVEVSGGATDWASVSSGFLHTCARKTTGRLYCWGFDADGRLGDGGSDTNQPAPVEVAGAATDWASVTLGTNHTCARKTNRRLYCWGLDDRGQAGTPSTFHPEPSEVVDATFASTADWTAVDAGGDHTCGRRRNGRLSCWGADDNGEVGDGGADLDQPYPVEVA